MFDVLVVGAGPAGLAAACCAAEGGRHIGIVDDNPDVGGQIWRAERAPAGGVAELATVQAGLDPKSGDSGYPTEAALWMKRLSRVVLDFLPGTQIVGRPRPGSLLAERDRQPYELAYQKLIVATGARERFLPFPGWTLPNVMGAGGLQALVKSGLPIEGKRVVVAGTGPLLFAVAAYLLKRGAHVSVIAEQAPWRKIALFGLGLWRFPSKMQQAFVLKWRLRHIPYAAGTWPIAAEGKEHIESVALRNGKITWKSPCDYLACGFGLVPNLELPALLGCDLTSQGVRVNELQESSAQNVYCAGETTGIGGLDVALLEGRIAGYAASGLEDRARTLIKARQKAHAFAYRLESAFALRDELRHLCASETLVCRCEDGPYAKLKPHASWTDAKLQTRLGMGPCQGRVCGPATEFLFGWRPVSTRPPLFPTCLTTLAGIHKDEA